MTPSGDAHDFLRKLSASRKEINAGIISVSYTHLDVYKRQFKLTAL